MRRLRQGLTVSQYRSDLPAIKRGEQFKNVLADKPGVAHDARPSPSLHSMAAGYNMALVRSPLVTRQTSAA